MVACVGGGSNSIGIFTAFLDDERVRLIGVEGGGRSEALGEHAARFDGGSLGVLHGTRTFVLQDREGQIAATHSVSAGLDYPAVGPEHVMLHDAGRVEYTRASDQEAVEAFHLLSRTEGILPALESAHALAEVRRRAPKLSARNVILVNLSGRGDKDVESVLAYDEEARARAASEAEAAAGGRRPLFAVHGGEIERAEPQERPHGAHDVSAARALREVTDDAPQPDVPQVSGETSDEPPPDPSDLPDGEGDNR